MGRQLQKCNCRITLRGTTVVIRFCKVTFGGAAAALGDRVLYPYLLRAYPPSSSTGTASATRALTSRYKHLASQ
eukprot:2653034-Amphidinium_carterae.1